MQADSVGDRSVFGVSASLRQLSDAELLAGARRLVGRSNQLLAELLAHLGEVEARGIHRTRACSSLYAYCIYELRFSEDEAFRRVAAARLVRRFPSLFDALASGELHLTGLLLLGPHLTEGNLAEVLARAKHRSKREIVRLVRILDPLPAVPARIEPLGPAPARVIPDEPSWEQFVQSMCRVRELAPGERPRDWMDSSEPPDRIESANDPGPHRTPSAPLAPPERYKVQFTASEEYVRLVEQAKALLSHAVPNATLEELQLRAMRAFVAALTKKKYATTFRESSTHPRATRTDREPPREDAKPEDAEPTDPRRRGRHIPAAVRRAVFARVGHRCSYVDVHGRQCAEIHRLEFHHIEPFAAGGDHTTANLTLRCAAHNALAAEEDFGRQVIQEKRLKALANRNAVASEAACIEQD